MKLKNGFNYQSECTKPIRIRNQGPYTPLFSNRCHSHSISEKNLLTNWGSCCLNSFQFVNILSELWGSEHGTSIICSLVLCTIIFKVLRQYFSSYYLNWYWLDSPYNETLRSNCFQSQCTGVAERAHTTQSPTCVIFHLPNIVFKLTHLACTCNCYPASSECHS